MTNPQQEGAHTGPIKSPQQVLLAGFFSFVVPIIVIIALVTFVVSGDKPAPSGVNAEKAKAERLQKVGMVEIRNANRPLRTGEEVFKGQCAACHATGAAGAPKFGEAAAWAPRIATGSAAMLKSVINGKNAMPPRAGDTSLSDDELKAALEYLVGKAK